ncbi:MAG: glycosyltransferase, partial [Oscillospiraceae bacterium]|nr:glycosyltransferase [Oscillospiraceae bacterium]
MSKSPFFTIGIPVYNMEKWVAACLDSILCQDFADFELICVDDGSRDSSLEILNSYAAKDSRIKVIHKENSGVSLTRNAIHANARGEYIYAIDSDDVMCENVLSAVYDIIVKNNYPDIVQTGCIKNFNGNIT